MSLGHGLEETDPLACVMDAVNASRSAVDGQIKQLQEEINKNRADPVAKH